MVPLAASASFVCERHSWLKIANRDCTPSLDSATEASGEVGQLYPPYGVPWGIRTLDLLLRRQLLYPAELKVLERVMGIEPT